MKAESQPTPKPEISKGFLRFCSSFLLPPSSFLRSSFALRLLSCLILVALGAGCTAPTRYRVLTFFFEGVPPPGYKPPGTTTAAAGGPRLANPVSFHRAFREDRCTECHVDKEAPFKEAIPGLCWQCHTRPSSEHPWNHAPERVGDCLACHVGHETMLPHLLASEGKDLCYKCHRQKYIEDLPAHKGVSLDGCLSCHPYHVGGTRLPERAGATSVTKAPEHVNPSGAGC